MRFSNLRLVVFLAALASLGLAPIPKPKPDPAKEDLKRLQGDWAYVRVVRGGLDATAASRGGRVSFAGARCTLSSAGSELTTGLRLDARARPKRFKLGGAFVVAEGTYELKGETLTLSYLGSAKERVTLTLKREGPKVAPPSRTGRPRK